MSNVGTHTIEFSTDPAESASWSHISNAASAHKTINNLKSGTRYWFRIAAINTVGLSDCSEHTTKIAPQRDDEVQMADGWILGMRFHGASDEPEFNPPPRIRG